MVILYVEITKWTNLQSDSKDLNGKLDDMCCVEVDRRVSCLDDGPG